MSTKIIKALVNGVVQDIEVEEITSGEQPLSYDERLDTLEDKHDDVITDGNFLVGNGTTEMKEITPKDVLSHIGGANIMTMTQAEYDAMSEDEINTNTLYGITDYEEAGIDSYELITTDDIDTICGAEAFNYDEEGNVSILSVFNDSAVTYDTDGNVVIS